ncbi:MAG: hypothetical protein LBS21_05780 [Clostridiales bacterium]|jgi:hypothetical protein|nr:hypothetical protein [Clostridiales bacterium]
MRTELIQLTQYTTNDNPIELDDYLNNSYAVYRAKNNNNDTFIYYRPDEIPSPEPRCDYILTRNDALNFTSRFIELKGGDIQRKGRCCRTEWDHAFHQLACTYNEFEPYINSQTEAIMFVMCTSIEKKRVAAKFTKYKWYKALQQYTNSVIVILYKNDFDETLTAD